MADIRIEKKESSGSIWPWILGLLVAALAVWGIAEAFDEGEEALAEEGYEEMDVVADRGAFVDESEVYSLVDLDDDAIGADFDRYAADYEAYTANMTGEMGLDHTFSHNALTKLANATAALATAYGMQGDMNVSAKKKSIIEAADYITKDPYDTDHADKIRMAAMSITDILEAVQKANYPTMSANIAELRASAMDISKATLTLNQKEDVRDFFSKARVIIASMRAQPVEGIIEQRAVVYEADGEYGDNYGVNTDPDNVDIED